MADDKPKTESRFIGDLEAECRTKLNDICLVHDHWLGRLVGYHEDAMDAYYIVRTMRGEGRGRETPEGGRETYATMVGACTSLKGIDRYDRLESMFSLNGCPPVPEFISTRDERPAEEQFAEYDKAFEGLRA